MLSGNNDSSVLVVFLLTALVALVAWMFRSLWQQVQAMQVIITSLVAHKAVDENEHESLREFLTKVDERMNTQFHSFDTKLDEKIDRLGTKLEMRIAEVGRRLTPGAFPRHGGGGE